MIRKYIKTSGIGNKFASLASMSGGLTWEEPSFSDYQVLSRYPSSVVVVFFFLEESTHHQLSLSWKIFILEVQEFWKTSKNVYKCKYAMSVNREKPTRCLSCPVKYSILPLVSYLHYME
jgi:hypothetical protein